MPLGPYKTFGECVGAQRRKGKSPESAKKICGKLEQQSRNASQQLPASLKPAVERSQKALKFLEKNNALVDTSLDTSETLSQSPVMTSESTLTMVDEESYADKITRVMDEYGVDEDHAVIVVNKLIEDEQRELDRRQFELTKQLEIERAQEASGQSDQQSEPEPAQPEQEQEPIEEENVNHINNPES